MSTLSQEQTTTAHWAEDWDIWRCLKCQSALHYDASASALLCSGCAARLGIENDIAIVKDQTSANNAVAQQFYDSPLWPKFRFWEYLTWACNFGERRARNKVLRHLPSTSQLDLLDVAVGDGVYLEWLPKDWRIVGIDISRSQLDACRRRAVGRRVWLAQGEAEELPLESQSFDAVLSIGAFNYFNDPAGSLAEMIRVARPGAPIVISDEVPNLTDRMIGHKLGIPAIDRWIVSRMMHLGDSFTDMVERHRSLDIKAIAAKFFKDYHYESVWWGVGYVLVGRAPA
jgi:ubiquinone/menaquinone biosynthesis C-methylase UbiE